MPAGADAKRLKELETRLSRVEHQVMVIRQEARAAIATLRAVGKTVATNLAALQAVVTTHESRLDTVTAAGQALQATVATHTTQLGQVQNALQNHAARLTALEAHFP